MSASRYVTDNSGFIIDETGSHNRSIPDENYDNVAVVIVKKEDISDDEDNVMYIDSGDETEYFELLGSEISQNSYESEKDINTKTHINPNTINILVSSSTKTDVKNVDSDSSASSLKLNIVDNKDNDERQKKSKYSSAALVSKSQCEKNEDISLTVLSTMQQFKCSECGETFDLKSHLILHELCHEKNKGNSQMSQEVVIVKEEILSDHEEIPNADNDNMPDECCDLVETSLLPENESHLELNNEKSVSNSVGQPLKNASNSNFFALLVNSGLKTYHKIYKDIRSSEENNSKHVNEQSIDSKSNLDMKTFNENLSCQIVGLQPNVQQFKCEECGETFDLKSHLILHELCHEKGNSDLSQDVVIVKEEILSDDEEIPNADDVNMPDECCEFLEASSFSENGRCLELNNEKSELNSVGQPLKDANNSNLVAVFVNSRLKTCHEIYKDIKSSEKNDPRHVKVKVIDNKSNTDMMKTFNNDPQRGSAYQKRRITTPICKNMHSRPERNFKCEECDECFELKSHLVMHEISHERYRKYVQCQVKGAQKQVDETNTINGIYKCNKCTLTFKFKNHLELHKMSHMKCKCHYKKPGSKSTELCTCFVRLCVSCGRNFFASIKLKNWTKCIKCCLHIDSVMKLRTAFPMETHSELKDEPSRKIRKIEGSNSFTSTVTDVKRLCYSCGKMCANVIRFNTSWLCYNCWNVRLQQRSIANLLGGKNKKRKVKAPRRNEGVDCAYCLILYPERSHFSNHKCLHKSVYLKEDDYCDDYKIGQHFLLSSLGNPTDIDELKQEDNFRDSEKSDNEQDEEMANVAVQISENNDDSLTKFVLCDKTGELINLNSVIDTDNVIQKDFQNETSANSGKQGE